MIQSLPTSNNSKVNVTALEKDELSIKTRDPTKGYNIYKCVLHFMMYLPILERIFFFLILLFDLYEMFLYLGTKMRMRADPYVCLLHISAK